MRILHVVCRSHRRGSELAAMELADELDRLGHRNRVVALGPAPSTAARSRAWRRWGVRGERGRPSWCRWRGGCGACWRTSLWTWCWPTGVGRRRWRPWPSAAVVRKRAWLSPLLVWQRILGLPDKVWDPVRRRWWGIVARRFDAGVALTDDQAAELRRLGFRGPVWVIPNFRKPDRFRDLDRAAAAARLRAEVGVPDGRAADRVRRAPGSSRSGPTGRWRSWPCCRHEGCTAHLVVAGTGPLRPELEAHAERLGVAGAVTFLGHRHDVEWVFGGVDLALLTSEAEGIPGVAIEALMAGCPMVTVPVGGVTEVVEHGVTGLVLDGFEPAAMAEAVARLLADDDTRAAMSRAARLRTDRFSASAAAAVYAERLTAALAGR